MINEADADCHYGDHFYKGRSAQCSHCGYLNAGLLAYYRYAKAAREGRAHSDHYHKTLEAAAKCKKNAGSLPIEAFTIEELTSY